jgi:phosphoenolpyruvate synthase/pyruvate phosphate dikinase
MNAVHDIEIIAGTGREVKGKICFPDRGDEVTEDSIIVIPHGGENYHVPGMKCKAIICEIGNRLCHLAIVTREYGKIMVRMPNAIESLKDTKHIWLRCAGSKGVAVELGE